VPWKPSYTEAEASEATAVGKTWKEVLERLDCQYHGKNIATLRRWAAVWEIPLGHLSDQRGRKKVVRRYTEQEAREAIRASRSWAEALRRLGYCPGGSNPAVLKRRAREWAISVDHFDPYAAARGPRKERIPLKQILVRGSPYHRAGLKRRLYEEGLKHRICELCGQGEIWQERRISLILDHINGVRDDNRLENLRIICPNCAASLNTHCSRNRTDSPLREPRKCRRCGEEFFASTNRQRYCSPHCGRRWDRRGRALVVGRKVDRPPEDQLLREIEELGYLGVGRRYGVSDNAVRKWVKAYARERAVAEGRDPDVVEIPTRTWPNMKKRAA
jgi:hypothetical protein